MKTNNNYLRLAAVMLAMIISTAATAQTSEKEMEKTIDSKTLWKAFATDNDKARNDYDGE